MMMMMKAKLYQKLWWMSLCGIVVNLLDFDIGVREFELMLRYFIHFWTNSHGKSIKTLIPLSDMG